MTPVPMISATPRVTVSALITSTENRLLIVQPVGAHHQGWSLPGGPLPAGRSPAEALYRYLPGQLGLNFPVLGLRLTAYRQPDLDTDPNDSGEIVLLFDCGRYDTGPLSRDGLRPGRDIVKLLRWVTLDEAAGELTRDELWRVRSAFGRSSAPAAYLEQSQHQPNRPSSSGARHLEEHRRQIHAGMVPDA